MVFNNDNTINFDTLITKENLFELNVDDINFINKESLYHANYLRQSYDQEYLKNFLVKRAREISSLGYKYRNKNETIKELIAANIVFNDDEAFIKALLSKGIKFFKLYSYLRLISNVKKNNDLEMDSNRDIEVAKSQIKYLCCVIRYYFGVKDFNLIIAKLNEVIILKGNLYKKLEEEQFGPKVKTR